MDIVEIIHQEFSEGGTAIKAKDYKKNLDKLIKLETQLKNELTGKQYRLVRDFDDTLHLLFINQEDMHIKFVLDFLKRTYK